MAFRSSAVLAFRIGGGTDIPAPVPPGAAINDIALAFLFVTNNVSASLAGWTFLTPPTYQATGQKGGVLWAWKRLTAADTGVYDFGLSGASGGDAAWVGLWSGRVASGSPFDFTTVSGVDVNQTQPTVVGGTATTGADLAYSFSQYTGTVPITVATYTSRINNADGDNLFTIDNTSAGAKAAQADATVSTNWWSMFASMIVAAGGVTRDLAGTMPAVSAAKASLVEAKTFTAKSIAVSAAKATSTVARGLAAKSPAVSALKGATAVARGLASKAPTASSAKATQTVARALTVKAAAVSSATGALTTTHAGVVALAGKSPAASSAKATCVVGRRYTGKATAASGARGTLSGGSSPTRGITAYSRARERDHNGDLFGPFVAPTL